MITAPIHELIISDFTGSDSFFREFGQRRIVPFVAVFMFCEVHSEFVRIRFLEEVDIVLNGEEDVSGIECGHAVSVLEDVIESDNGAEIVIGFAGVSFLDDFFGEREDAF